MHLRAGWNDQPPVVPDVIGGRPTIGVLIEDESTVTISSQLDKPAKRRIVTRSEDLGLGRCAESQRRG